MKAIDMRGRRVGKLTVTERTGSTQDGKAAWLCRCDCGSETVVAGAELRHGGHKSCGCEQQSGAAAARRTHGKSKTPIHLLWRNMINRCEWPGAHNYHRYGGRGIRVCQAWREDASAFIAWCETNGWAPGLELDRRDNDKGYEPGNCRFITRAENQRNKSSSSGVTPLPGAIDGGERDAILADPRSTETKG